MRLKNFEIIIFFTILLNLVLFVKYGNPLNVLDSFYSDAVNAQIMNTIIVIIIGACIFSAIIYYILSKEKK
ncbi:MAG TPA: hypothetical protein PLM75_07995 [bacterium]|nr:hypothetical protein [bacterium]HPP87781.1 hypothetical protein [bacterium]